jgi:hypothetical protein
MAWLPDGLNEPTFQEFGFRPDNLASGTGQGRRRVLDARPRVRQRTPFRSGAVIDAIPGASG